MKLERGARVIIAAGPARGLEGTLVEVDVPMKPYGKTQLAALFPAKGALAKLAHLSVRGWTLDERQLTELNATGRAALRTVHYGWDKELALGSPKA